MRRHDGARMAAMLGIAVLAIASGPSLAGRQARDRFDLPLTDREVEQSLARGDSHEWRVDLAASEYLEVIIQPLDVVFFGSSQEWPRVTMTAPDGAIVFDRTAPNAALSIDIGPQMVVSFVSERAGLHRLTVTAREPSTPRQRYRLRVARRHFASDDDRQRMAAHRLWNAGMRAFLEGSADAKRASLGTFEDAARLLAMIPDDEGEALTFGTIASLSYVLSDPARGSAAASRALDVWQRLGRHREAAIVQSDRGLLAFMAYDHPLARRYYEEALPQLHAIHDAAGEATTLVRLGWIDYAAGDMSRVIELNQQAIPLWRDAGDVSGESVSLNDLGRAYVDLGDVAGALDAYQRALATRPSEQNPRGAAQVLVRIGLLYLSVADWQRALDALHEALALARRAKDARSEASILSNVGLAYDRIGDHEEARRYLEPALQLGRSIPIRNVEANVLAVLGVEAFERGELERSRTYFQQALAIQTEITDARGQASTLRYLASTQLALGLPREALDSITHSLEKASDGRAGVSSLTTLASVHAALGNAADARAAFERALARAREVRARDQEATVLALFGRFRAHERRYADARDLLEQGLAIHESLRNQLRDPDQRMTYSSRSVTPYEAYIDVLMELHQQSPGSGFDAEAFRTAERARGRGLLELLSASGVDIRRDVDADLIARERTLRWNLNAKAAIQTRLLSESPGDRRLRVLDQEIADLSKAWRETTAVMRDESPAYASLSEPQPLSAAEASALLDSRTVLLEYAPGDTRSWLFAVTNQGLESFALPRRTAIDDAARAVDRLLTARQPIANESAANRQSRVERADRELASRSRALSDLVLGPIGARLATEWRERRLVIVARGALEYVPFSALPLPGRGDVGSAMLVSTHEIVTLPSASSLAILRREGSRRTPATKTVAVFADPVFAADDPRVRKTARVDDGPLQASAGTPTRSVAERAFEPFVGDDARGSLARLPFSRAEALAVATQVPRDSLLQATDFDATLALATSERLADYRILHFATHGLINTTRPELSGLALSLVDAQGRSRDGFLRLNTIYNLRLSADLVVLSACQTALGKDVAGEGLVGLTRGFMFAGARRVIASLWQVSDAATADLMKRLYVGMLQRHLPPAAALRQAQLEMSRDPRWSSPYYWAGFVLQGDWV